MPDISEVKSISEFDIFFSVAVHHSYFRDDQCRHLQFTPSNATARLMKKTGMIFKQGGGNRFSLFYEADHLDGLKMYMDDPFDPLCFFFRADSTDTRFLNYTEPAVGQPQTILFFSNRAADTVNACLTADTRVSKKDFADPASPEIARVLADMCPLPPPHFIIALYPNGTKNQLFNIQGQPAKNHFHIKFLSRKTRWKYIVSGKKALDTLLILDKDQRINFIKTPPPDLPFKEQIQTFISDRSILLCETAAHRFELKDERSCATLIKRLPTASPDIIFKIKEADKSHYFSEIFINI